MKQGEDLESQFRRLEEIGEQIRNPEISLDSAVDLLKEGMALSQKIESKLDQIESQVEIVSNDEKDDEELKFEPYSTVI